MAVTRILLIVSVVITIAVGDVIYNVLDYGAKGDGVTKDTAAIAKTIAAVGSGPATVFFPAGKYLTGRIALVNNMVLQLDPKAIILGSTDVADFPLVAALPSYPVTTNQGGHNSNPRYSPVLFGDSVTNVIITGGVVDGQGKFWWDSVKTLNYSRPPLVQFLNSEKITISNVTLQNSPFYTVHIYTSNNILVDNIHISNPLDTPNTDGIDPDSSSNVVIRNSAISTSDDHISLKSGKGPEGTAFNRSTTNVTVYNIDFGHGGGIAIGSETAGSITNVVFRDSSIALGANTVRMKTCVSYGGEISNITYSNIYSESTDIGIFVDMYYECSATNSSNVPRIKDIYLNNIRGVAVRAGEFNCAPQQPCEVDMNGVHLKSVEGFTCNNVVGTVQDVSPKPCY